MKKLMALLTILAMSVTSISLTGCGGKTDKKDDTKNETKKPAGENGN